MGSVEQVLIARRTGFCYGVREAIDAARLSAAEGATTHTLGHVVHNEGVIADLEAHGIRTAESLDDVDGGSVVVIRAHGVTPETMRSAERKGLKIIDGTCAWVLKEHKEMAGLVEEGYTVVLLGTPGHPEVTGLLGFAPEAILVDEEEDWPRIPHTRRMALISQSTQPPWKFERLAAYMVSRCHELKIINTICPVTIRRQQDTIDLAEQVDLVVVVGGRRSANTRELTRLVGLVARPVVQIERAGDLEDASLFDGYRVIGVTGGTSTPMEDLQAVVRRIYELAGTPQLAADAERLAGEAARAVAVSAYRSTSLGSDGRPLPARDPVFSVA